MKPKKSQQKAPRLPSSPPGARVPGKAERQHAVDEFNRGHYAPLERICNELLLANPLDPFAYVGLGNLETKRGEHRKALDYFTRGLAVAPNDSILHANISSVSSDLCKYPEAYEHARRAVELSPTNYAGWLNLANACNRLNRYGESESVSREALKRNPGDPGILNNLATALKELGRIGEATEAYLKALESTPDFDGGFVNLLLTLLYHPDAGVDDIVLTARTFGERIEARTRHQQMTHVSKPEPWRRLRVGLISPDFRSHAVMYFTEPLLARLDRRHFELVGYYLTVGEDKVTERARRMCDRFYNIAGLEPLVQAERIRADGIDVLIDLAGHTARTGLVAMAYRPAPVQMTWLGYPGTSGLTTIDWRITDTVADPPGADAQYSEKLIRLPPLFCVYRASLRNPLDRYAPAYQVKNTPALKNGFITFGCCNNIGKLTTQTLRLWGRLMQSLPTARLMIEAKGLHDADVEAALRAKLVAHGIPEPCLLLVAQENRNQYLTYHFIDIALDPFPLTGGTTSCDLLWMGLPLVTMAGDSFRSRMGMAICESIGHAEWVARDDEDYIEIAKRLAVDIPALNAQRLAQRARIETGPLMDELRFADLFGEAVRQSWLQWCAQSEPQNTADAVVAAWIAERPAPGLDEHRVFLRPGESIPLIEALARLAANSTADDWAAARALAILILETIPYQPDALLAMGESERRLGGNEMSVQFYSHALDHLADPVQASFRLVEWLLEDGQRQSAIDVLTWLLTRFPALEAEVRPIVNSLLAQG